MAVQVWQPRRKRTPEAPETTARRSADRKAANREIIRTAKDRPCADCEGKFHYAIMQFDHRPDEIKLYTISQMVSRATSVLLAEIAKCDVVCANCHAMRTFLRATAPGGLHERMAEEWR